MRHSSDTRASYSTDDYETIPSFLFGRVVSTQFLTNDRVVFIISFYAQGMKSPMLFVADSSRRILRQSGRDKGGEFLTECCELIYFTLTRIANSLQDYVLGKLHHCLNCPYFHAITLIYCHFE